MKIVARVLCIYLLVAAGSASAVGKNDLEEFPVAGVNAQTPGYFPFFIPPLDVSKTFIDMSFLNPEPAGAKGRVRPVDGHFVDGGGNRVRLLGSNLTFRGPFPDKEIAPAIAAHMRKMGMNVIRFHHIDMATAPRGIWADKEQSGFDAAQLDKLDFLIHQLKQNGIYINLNLHVSRTYPRLAAAKADSPQGKALDNFKYGKALDNFYPEFIRQQKDYARALLTHRNAYTGMTYAEDPVVIVVEINNENALTEASWKKLDEMPEPYKGELTQMWNAWLKKRYGGTDALHKAWGVGSTPLGAELLRNPDFAQGPGQWASNANSGAKMTLAVEKADGIAAERALRIQTLQAGSVAWSLQFLQGNLTFENGKPYTLRFFMRADAECEVETGVRLNQAPWKFCGLQTSFKTGPQWREYSWTFEARDALPGVCRVEFNFKNRIGAFWLAAPSLRPGGTVGLPEGQTVEKANITMPLVSGSTAGARADLYAFLCETEQNYVRDMMAFLKNDLAVQAMIADTQVSYGDLQGMWREASLSDYCDMHAYWQHPHFPVTPWHSQYWYVPNKSMAADARGGAAAGLAWWHCADKPYTVSEYDHPAPMSYSAELFPMIASFGAFQDWDGIYQFDYGTPGDTADPSGAKNRLAGFFNLSNHPGKAAFLPVAAVMFRMGAVRAGDNPLVATVHTGDLPALMAQSGSGLNLGDKVRRAQLVRPVRFRLAPGDGGIEVEPVEVPTSRTVTNTGEIEWNIAQLDAAAYTVNCPAVRVAVGFIGGRTISLGDVSITVGGEKNHWAAVAVCALDGKALAESTRTLIVAAGRVENTDMKWNALGNSVGKNWGAAPVVAEGIPAVIALPRSGKVFALDATGAPAGDVPVADGKIQIGPQYKTLWYGVTP